MIVPQTHKCDAQGCAEQHSGTNGWTAVLKDREGGIHLFPFAVAESKGFLAYAQVFCGAAHLHAAISEMLGEQAK